VLAETNETILTEILNQKSSALRKKAEEDTLDIKVIGLMEELDDISLKDGSDLAGANTAMINLLAKHGSIFSDTKNLESLPLYSDLKYDHNEAIILLRNICLRNKLRMIEAIVQSLSSELMEFEDVLVDHQFENEEVNVIVTFISKASAKHCASIQKLTINGKHLPNRPVTLGLKEQRIIISLGKLKQGNHRFECELSVLRNHLPYKQHIDYEFEI
jgi:hypothetical protein